MVFHEFSWIVTWMKNVIFSRVAQMSCTRQKKTWHHVVDLSCFFDVLDVSSCRSETLSLIEEFRGRVSKIDVDFRDVKGVWF